MGDFIIHVDTESDIPNVVFKAYLDSFSFTLSPTHSGHHTFDLVLTYDV